MISKQRKQELRTLGYYVEDMEKEYGDAQAGMFRWMNDFSDDFQDDEPSYSPAAAWDRADQRAKQLVTA